MTWKNEGFLQMWLPTLQRAEDPGRKTLSFPRELAGRSELCAFHSGDSTWITFKGVFYSSHSVAHHCLENKMQVK